MKLFFKVALSAVFLTLLMTTRTGVGSSGSLQKPDDLKSVERKATQLDKTSVFQDFDFGSFDNSKKCGYRKCFFLSKSNTDFGYVVGHPSFFDVDLKAYELAKRLEKEDGANQPNVSPPEIVTLDAFVGPEIRENSRYQDENSIVVSKVHAIRPDAILMGCDGKIKSKVRHTTKTTRMLKSALPRIIARSEDALGFYLNFEKSIKTTKDILIKVPGLINDMQVLVDKFGNFYQIDLDRAFQRNPNVPEDKTKRCFDSLDNLLVFTRDLLRVREIEEAFIRGIEYKEHLP